jgi:hypothetical protein
LASSFCCHVAFLDRPVALAGQDAAQLVRIDMTKCSIDHCCSQMRQEMAEAERIKGYHIMGESG